jgi:hypothetical protein
MLMVTQRQVTSKIAPPQQYPHGWSLSFLQDTEVLVLISWNPSFWHPSRGGFGGRALQLQRKTAGEGAPSTSQFRETSVDI